jgi:CheY-like chemotaxis protein
VAKPFDTHLPQTADGVPPGAPTPTNRKRILLVHEDPEALAHVRPYLVGGGYDVFTSRPGEALAFVTTHQPDLIMLDTAGQGLSELAVCSQIRGNAPSAKTPMLLLGASPVPEKTGCDLHLPKATPARRILDLVDLLLSGEAPRRGTSPPGR